MHNFPSMFLQMSRNVIRSGKWHRSRLYNVYVYMYVRRFTHLCIYVQTWHLHWKVPLTTFLSGIYSCMFTYLCIYLYNFTCECHIWRYIHRQITKKSYIYMKIYLIKQVLWHFHLSLDMAFACESATESATEVQQKCNRSCFHVVYFHIKNIFIYKYDFFGIYLYGSRKSF